MASLSRTALLFVCVSRAQALDESVRSCSDVGRASDSACGGSAHDEVSAMQLRHSSPREQWVLCPGSETGPGLQYRKDTTSGASLHTDTHCTFKHCCPGTTATDNKTFPCPLDPGFKCETTAPEEIEYTLVVGTCPLTLSDVDKPVVTRCYNGSIPGPTLFIKPGMIVTIHVHNTLEQPNPPPLLVNITSDFNGSFRDQGKYGNETEYDNDLENTYTSPGTGSPYGHVNSTNLHVHGIVVPGHQPADDVLITIMPGHKYTYVYNIPTYHMPGTHWYHPHRHHATGNQVNGGMFGALIVKDTANSIPPEYADAEEYILRINTLWAPLQESISRLAKDNLWDTQNSSELVTLVNGNVTPAFSIKAGSWYRLRMIYAAEFRTLRPVLHPFEGKCQMKLIAKDGVYLNVAPRTVTAMWLATGNTADVMISCSCTKATSCSTMMLSTWNSTKQKDEKTNAYSRTFDGELLRLDISGDKSGSLPVLPKFEVKRPCYLVDLRNATVLEGNKHVLALEYVQIFKNSSNQRTFTEQNAKMYEIPGADITESNTAYFGVGWDNKRHDRFMHDDQPPMDTLPMEQVQDWNVSGVDSHPLHIHVQPYQLQELQPTSDRIEPEGAEEWDQPGDWHDTFFSASGSDWATIRYAFRLRGIDKLILHCHFLNHEDQGLMAYFNVTDSKCDHPDQCAEAIAAKTSAGTCFTNYYTLEGPGYKLVH